MGLDMYLWRELNFSDYQSIDGESAHDGATPVSQAITVGGLPSGVLVPELGIKSISQQICYWRKANQIHHWFVQHTQNNIDECQQSYVNREQLAGLVQTCRKVLREPAYARELLPPQAGFFFGSTDIDEWYRQDLEHTVKSLERFLAIPPPDMGFRIYESIYYQSSW